jgi:hypothetical protein
MRCRLGIGEGTICKRQSLVDATEYPQCEGVENLRYGAGIRAELVGEIATVRRVVELESLLKIVMSAGEVAEMKTSGAGNAMSDQGLGAIRPGRRLGQEKLGHFAHGCGLAAGQMPHPETVIGGKSPRRVFRVARQFAGARKGRAGFRRLMALGPDQGIAEARL